MNIHSAHYLPGTHKKLGDRYLLLECLGDGSHGWVWRAERLTDETTVAVKIPKQLVKEDRLLVEGKELIGAPPHENVIQIFDMGRVPPEKEWFAIEMEYFPSESLAQKLEHRARNFSGTYERLLNIFSQVLNAVGHLASLAPPVSHGDIKPHNILIGQGDLVKLTDFGSSALPEEIYVRTRENGGTVLYAAPEYADCISRKGNFEELLKGDIYSLGVLLYQLMTARLPHDTQNQARTYAPFPKPREVNSGICPALEDVILKALAKMPEDRFNAIDDFKAAFSMARDSQLEYGPERIVRCQYQTKTEGFAELEKYLDEKAYDKAVKTARQMYLNAPEATALLQLLEVLYQAERFYDLQQELSNHSGILDLIGEEGKKIRIIALKTMLRLHQVSEIPPLLNKALELNGNADGNEFELNLIHASTLGMQAQYGKAKDVLEAMNKKYMGRIQILKRLIQVCEQLRDYEGASGYLRTALRFVKNDDKLNEKRVQYEALGLW